MPVRFWGKVFRLQQKENTFSPDWFDEGILKYCLAVLDFLRYCFILNTMTSTNNTYAFFDDLLTFYSFFIAHASRNMGSKVALFIFAAVIDWAESFSLYVVSELTHGSHSEENWNADLFSKHLVKKFLRFAIDKIIHSAMCDAYTVDRWSCHRR